jgi:hypothetical protein
MQNNSKIQPVNLDLYGTFCITPAASKTKIKSIRKLVATINSLPIFRSKGRKFKKGLRGSSHLKLRAGNPHGALTAENFSRTQFSRGQELKQQAKFRSSPLILLCGKSQGNFISIFRGMRI